MRPSYDVVIAGAGVAGSIAGLLFARQGLSVLIADQKIESTKHKVLCTHFVQPVARPILAKLGLEDRIEAAGGVPTKAAFWTSAGWIDPPGDYGLAPDSDGRLLAMNIERRILDPLLLEEMTDLPNLDLRLATSVDAPEPVGAGGIQVAVTTEAGDATVRAGLLVAADGRRSSLARTLGNVPVIRKENQRVCLFGYFEGVAAPPGNRSLFMLGDREMAFLYPLGGTRILLSAYIPKDAELFGTMEEKAAALIALFERYPGVPDFSQARLVSRMHGFRDYPNLVRHPVHAGVAFLGDAALSLDPMSGVGCSFAMKTADMLVDAMTAPLRVGTSAALERGLATYAEGFQAFFAPHAAGIAADSVIAKSAATTASVYARIVRNPHLQRVFMALTGRLVSPGEFQRAFLKASMADARRAA